MRGLQAGSTYQEESSAQPTVVSQGERPAITTRVGPARCGRRIQGPAGISGRAPPLENALQQLLTIADPEFDLASPTAVEFRTTDDLSGRCASRPGF